MKEKEPKQSFLTWEAAVVVLASVGFGAILGSREARSRFGRELGLCYRGLKNEMKRMHGARLSEEEKFRFWRLMRKAFPEGLRAEK